MQELQISNALNQQQNQVVYNYVGGNVQAALHPKQNCQNQQSTTFT